jgi:two-component system, chemotaxis family, response regulator Rcp1
MEKELLDKPVNILLVVEDCPDDVALAQEAFSQGNLKHELYMVEDGVEAMKFLRGEGKYKDFPRPHLVLLDLNLPKKNGFEVLREVKEDKDLKEIPVIVLSSSKAETDVKRCYRLHANCYIPKASDYHGYIRIVKVLEEFWLSFAILPNKE